MWEWLRAKLVELKNKPEPEPVLLAEPLAAEVDALLAQDEDVRGIKLVRERTGLDLQTAHRAVMARKR